MKTTGQGFDKIEIDTEFPYFDVMDRVLGGNEKFDPSFILDPGVEQEQNDENHTPSGNTKQKECDPEVSAIKSCTPDSLKKSVSSCKRKLSNSGSPMSIHSSGSTSSKSASTRSSKKTKPQNSGMEDDDKFMAFLEQSRDSDREMMERMLDFTAQAEIGGNDLALKLVKLFGKI